MNQDWWLKFKEEAVSALAKLVIWGSGILLTWAIFYAFIGRHEMEKVSENLNIRMTNEFNESVKRDAELFRKLSNLEKLLKKLYGHKDDEPFDHGPGDLHTDEEGNLYYHKHHKEHTPIQQQQQMVAPNAAAR